MSRKKDVPLSRANLRIWSKIGVFLGLVKFVSAYAIRGKIFLFFSDFPKSACAFGRKYWTYERGILKYSDSVTPVY